MNNDDTILKTHILIISTMQHHMLKFQNDLKNWVKSGKPRMRLTN